MVREERYIYIWDDFLTFAACRFWLLDIHGVYIRDPRVNSFWNRSKGRTITLPRLQTSFQRRMFVLVVDVDTGSHSADLF